MSNVNKHTPGPWHVGEPVAGRRFTQSDCWEIQHGYRTMVAVLYKENYGLDGSVDLANARLIAAAPELLIALKVARKVIGMTSDGNAATVLADLDATIAKAEGH